MAASRRTLGSGRVIGASKQPAPATVESRAVRENNSNILSPSDSTVSLQSEVSSSTPRTLPEDNDIASAATRDAAAPSALSNRLACPICNEEMVTLLQLNRHLDSEHSNLGDQVQDEVQTWFKSQVVKAKRFQPLAVLNQKLKGLDVFESNEDARPVSHSPRLQPSSGTATPEPVRQHPDEIVTREHWQRYTRDGLCSDPLCDRRLGATNGNINCRHCGKLFCEEHSMYQMKLSRSANWEPVRGFWCRVCETCFKSREGYNDHIGFERDHTKDFSAIRRKAVDKAYLDVSRLEKRLTKLTQLLSDSSVYEEQGFVNYLWSWSSGAPNQRRQLEQSIVDWEDDTSVTYCPFCMQEFSNYTFKRHHCRLCGRVVCADPATQCSTEVPLAVTPTPGNHSKKSPQDRKDKQEQLPIDIRMCQECKRTVFSKADFDRQLAEDPADQRAFRNLKEFERGIRGMLPRFQKLLTALQDPDNPPTQTQLSDASRVRKRLTDAFTQYNMAARRIRDLPTTSATQTRLQSQIYAQASQFLHIYMLPLKSVPKMLKHASPAMHSHHNSQSSQSSLIKGHLSAGADASNNNTPTSRGGGGGGRHGAHSPAPSQASSGALSSLEDEEKTLRERLMVLEEQKVMVAEMRADARRRRKVEEVESLSRNLEDLTRESETVQTALEGLSKEFEGIYLSGRAASDSMAPTSSSPASASASVPAADKAASWVNAKPWSSRTSNGV